MTTGPMERVDCQQYLAYLEQLEDVNASGIQRLAREKMKPGEKSALQLILETMTEAAELTGEPIHPPIDTARPPFENGLIGRLIERCNDAWQMIAVGGRWAAKKERIQKASEDEQAAKKALLGSSGENDVDAQPITRIIDTTRDGRTQIGRAHA